MSVAGVGYGASGNSVRTLEWPAWVFRTASLVDAADVLPEVGC